MIRITRPTLPAATSFPVLVAGRDIDAGKDGRLWVADFGGQVVRVKTDGTAKAFDTGAGSGLQAIAAGPKGQVGYADPTSNPQKVGRIKRGKLRRKTASGDPFGVAFGADRAYWIPRFASGDLLRLTKSGKTVDPRRPRQELRPAPDRDRAEAHALGHARHRERGRAGQGRALTPAA